MKAPIEPGVSTWTGVLPPKQSLIHEETSLPFSSTVKDQATSIGVCDVPCPNAFGSEFRIKVGVKCSAECNLTSKQIRVYGQKGKRLATGALGGVRWPGTSALYWAEVELRAPAVRGYCRWTVKFPKTDLELAHEETYQGFAFATARSPEHAVMVEVIDRDTKAAIRDAHVVLRADGGHLCRGYTDESGVATLQVPKGEYTLYASKGDEYEAFQTTVGIAYDATVRAELPVHYDIYR